MRENTSFYFVFVGWLIENPNWKVDNNGKEARCSLCHINLRAHHDGLVKHANTNGHKVKMASLNMNVQKNIKSFGKLTQAQATDRK